MNENTITLIATDSFPTSIGVVSKGDNFTVSAKEAGMYLAAGQAKEAKPAAAAARKRPAE